MEKPKFSAGDTLNCTQGKKWLVLDVPKTSNPVPVYEVLLVDNKQLMEETAFTGKINHVSSVSS